jgi:hypothetical protein
VVGAVIALTTGSGGEAAKARPPVKDLAAAAKAAGCEVSTHPSEGRGHEDRKFTAADYETNPPTSGPHFPQWAQDGVYAPGNTPPLGQLVHTLEHGRIDIQYRPGTDPAVVRELEALAGENDGYHTLLFQNETGMKPQVAATAWTHMITCDDTGAPMLDALRAFRDRYVDKGPEFIP